MYKNPVVPVSGTGNAYYRRYPLAFQLAITLVFSLPALKSRAQFALSGEIRPRSEFRNGFKTLNSPANGPAFFVEQRSRIAFDYATKVTAFRLTFQDVRVWGNTTQVYKADPSLTNVSEAWGEYRMNIRSAIRAGRQVLSYDNERFFGALDWAQQGRSHDALKYTYTHESGFSLHAGAAFNQDVPNEPAKLSGSFYNVAGNYKTLQFLWLHRDWSRAALSLLLVNDGRQRADSTTAFRQTYGLYAKSKKGPVSLQAEAYYQGGRDQSGNPVAAWMSSVMVGLPKSRFTPELGADVLSGTDRTAAGNHSFDPAFGTNHKFYGHMDYFYVGNPHQQNGRISGLADLYLQTKTTLSKKTQLTLNLHQFHAPVAVYEGVAKRSSLLGREVDAVLSVDPAPFVNFKLGYSQLFATRSLEILKQANHDGPDQWVWAMFTLKPALFTAN